MLVGEQLFQPDSWLLDVKTACSDWPIPRPTAPLPVAVCGGLGAGVTGRGPSRPSHCRPPCPPSFYCPDCHAAVSVGAKTRASCGGGLTRPDPEAVPVPIGGTDRHSALKRRQLLTGVNVAGCPCVSRGVVVVPGGGGSGGQSCT